MVDIMDVEPDMRFNVARGRVMKASSDLVGHSLMEDDSGAYYNAHGEYLDDALARAALDLVTAVNASDRKPIGWPS